MIVEAAMMTKSDDRDAAMMTKSKAWAQRECSQRCSTCACPRAGRLARDGRGHEL